MIHIKNKAEIQRMKDAGKLATEVLYETGERVKIGVSSQELNDFADRYTTKRGAESAPLNYRGFPRSICTSINDVVCHGIPRKDEILNDGDIINLDITVIKNGYHGDTSRMFSLGDISEETQTLLADTERSMYIGIDVIRPGGRISDIGEAIDEFLTQRKYGIVRDLSGHGIGKNFHEEPTVPHYKQNRIRNIMKPGMTFTVEPMVNRGGWQVEVDEKDGWTVRTVDGTMSAQFEHTCLVTEDGYEILTKR